MFQAKTLGLDSSGLNAVANAPAAKRAGIGYWFRYSAGQGNTSSKSQFKLAKVGEITAIGKAGIQFIANSEWYANRCEEGSAAGHADGVADLAFWKSRGLARGSSIYVSWDVAPSSSKYAAVEAYLRAYNTALGGYYHGDGFYAGIPALVHFSQIGLIRHGWIPSAAGWSTPNLDISDNYAPPAKTAWDLWFPTQSQVQPAMDWIKGRMAGHKLVSCVWQDGNQHFNHGADDNVILLPGPLGSHQEAAAGGGTGPIVKPPVTPPPATKHYGPMHGHGVPSTIARGTQQYYGSIDGPKASHGGFNAGERPAVKLIQQQLEFLGFVPGHSGPDGWADGIFDTRGGGVGNGPTSQAVARFQHRFMPGTSFYGQVWWDDWQKLSSLAKEDV